MNEGIKRWFIPALGIAVFINLFLFALVPLLLRGGQGAEDITDAIPVNLVRVRHVEKPPEEEERNKREKPEEKIAPKFDIDLSAPVINKVKMDRLAFEVNPGPAEGMPVAVPFDLDLAGRLGKPFYDLSEVDQKPRPILKLKPQYPFRAKQLKITGYVNVRFLVDKQGRVSRITILESVPQGVFDNTVRQTLTSWKFSPGRIEGRPVATWAMISIEFELE